METLGFLHPKVSYPPYRRLSSLRAGEGMKEDAKRNPGTSPPSSMKITVDIATSTMILAGSPPPPCDDPREIFTTSATP